MMSLYRQKMPRLMKDCLSDIGPKIWGSWELARGTHTVLHATPSVLEVS